MSITDRVMPNAGKGVSLKGQDFANPGLVVSTERQKLSNEKRVGDIAIQIGPDFLCGDRCFLAFQLTYINCGLRSSMSDSQNRKEKPMKTTSDYIPRREAELLLWLQNFIRIANASIAQTGLSAAQVASLNDSSTAYSNAFAHRQASIAAAKSSTLNKVSARESVVELARQLAMIIQKHPGATDQLKNELGLTVPAGPRVPVDTVVPRDLVAKVGPQGQIALKWDRAGNKKRTNFVLEVRQGAGGPWVFVAAITRTRYIDVGRSPGRFIQYRLHAVRTTKSSLYSDVASVYAPGGQASSMPIAA